MHIDRTGGIRALWQHYFFFLSKLFLMDCKRRGDLKHQEPTQGFLVCPHISVLIFFSDTYTLFVFTGPSCKCLAYVGQEGAQL